MLNNKKIKNSILLAYKLLPFFIGLFAGLFFITSHIIGFSFKYFPGDFGDGRLNLYFLEHAHKFFSGQVGSFWNAPFMYPEINVIAYSDNLLGSAPLYSLFRLLGFDSFTSYQWWVVLVASLNYTSAYLLLNKLFKNRYAAVLGAFVFAFSIALQSQLTHAQTFPRFAIPLAFLMAIYFKEKFNPKFFFLTILFVVYQIYCGIYLGFMLAIPIGIFIILLFYTEGETFRILKREKKWKFRMFGSLLLNILILMPLMYPYMQRNIAPGIRHYRAIINSIPTPQSHFFSQEGSLFWDFLSRNGQSLQAWWDHQIFAGGIATICLLISVAFLFYKLYKLKIQFLRDSLPMLLLLAGLITSLFYIRFGSISAYIFIYFLPGFSSMRSLTRIINIELIFFTIATAFIFSKILTRDNLLTFLLFLLFTGTVVADNYFKEGKSYRNEKKVAIERTAPLINLMSNIPKGSVVSYEPETIDLPPFFYQIDAMLAAQYCNLKTINAYTGTSPGSYNRFWSELSEESRNIWLADKFLSFDTLYVIKSASCYEKVLIGGVKDKEVKIQNIHEIIDYMKTDKNWMKSIKEKANARGISIDSMLMLDAIWVMKYQADERK